LSAGASNDPLAPKERDNERHDHEDDRDRSRGEAANFPKAWEDDSRGRDFIGAIIERWRQQ
jgi:hypothetical protein